ncbi:tRNA pseudouridine55 synthase [Microbacteriaceae bacterium SG_E_30_P1]|uniref:tRNA pseudouridine synthase B n=1 Tax=Antiquaquibacter oligotrophicus TaxID=2880260 RepID=A0ABT6KKT4_9MICO|nr:tRNA pseudouridine(55) synthase TruB [Antiquaquibacter oligotrophicus]MDH6180606.1 tRNA pseudouridine55 synthase [Antiquaquibacter oligotrophicus]UDF13661.1 tRNA pseudouridine(55) synthase TruB [Antiquaquibacter oligotrophicus]
MVARQSESVAPGILLVDKPTGLTSHGVVARARRALGTRKIGHAGTLDPMATGLLVLGIGSATRLLTWMVGLDKTYETTIRLGARTTTDDAEGDITSRATPTDVDAITDDRVREEVARLTGPILQRPSAVSAIKVDGKRAYARVREGEAVELPERPVTVHSFEVFGLTRGQDSDGQWIEVTATVECSSGTYIRALARDLGDALGVGGYLTALRRTRVGVFDVMDAAAIDDELAKHVVSPADVAARLFPVVELDAATTVDLGHGKRVALDTPDASPVAAVDPHGRLVGLVTVTNGTARVLTNFPVEDPSS